MANEQQKKWPHKRKAMQSVRDGVRRGNIDKPHICSNCHKVENKRTLAAHHSDYGERTNIQWLCPQCHKSTHKKLGHGVR